MTTPTVTEPVEPLWMMHVIGPDDIYPAPDHATAVDWCAYLNREIAPKTPSVMCVGVPAIWTGTAAEHADGLPEAIKGWSRPSAAPAPSSLAGGGLERVLREARKWIAGQPDRSTSEYQTSFAMLEAIDAALSPSSLAVGEVEDALKRLRVLRDQHRHGTAVTDADEYDADELDAILAVITPALSPEAPAEAGEEINWKAEYETLCGQTIKDREAIAKIIDPEAFVPMEDVIGMRKALVKADAILALRAQPPAREDAQPVAWSFELATMRDRETGEYSSWGEPRLSFSKPCVPEGSIRNLTALGPITHPAPDALRVAVEAFGVITDLSVNLINGGPDSNDLNDLSDALNTAVDVAHEALAALQQEGR